MVDLSAPGVMKSAGKRQGGAGEGAQEAEARSLHGLVQQLTNTSQRLIKLARACQCPTDSVLST
jgi:hypothetical protein